MLLEGRADDIIMFLGILMLLICAESVRGKQNISGSENKLTKDDGSAVVHASGSTCGTGEVRCKFLAHDGTVKCFRACQRCDGKVDCPGATDELGCPCRSKLKSGYICDGKLDCSDLSDELGCGDCLSDELSCSDGCVSLHSFCDGRSCPEFSRNLLCSRLSPIQADSSEDVIYRSMGYLQKKVRGKWLQVCGQPGNEIKILVDQYCADVTGIRNSRNDIKQEGMRSKSPVNWAIIKNGTNAYTNEPDITSLPVDNCSSRSAVYVQCAQPTCQKDSFSAKPKLSFVRIVGGKEAPADMWNFLVSILKNGEHHCGGTIVSPRWVLSASHCYLRISGNLFEIEAGSHRKNIFGPSTQRTVATRVIRHPEFDAYTMKNDVALLRLETPLSINRWVRTTCLSTGNDVFIREDMFCSVGGWGFVQENGTTAAETLQEVTVPILSEKECIREFFYVDPKKVFCAGYKAGGKDSCQGDSGGAIMCSECGSSDDMFSCKGNPWVQTGIVSFGRGCARPGMPGVYTKIQFYRDWILNTIKSVEENSNNQSSTIPTIDCDGLICAQLAGQCLRKSRVCDGQVDCFLATDEISCDKKSAAETDNISLTEASVYEYDEDKKNSVDEQLQETITTVPNDSVEEHLKTTITTVPLSPCSRNKYQCEITQECIPDYLLCDETRNCLDGTDEIACTCVDRIYHNHPERICDGHFDCFDFTDEFCDICGSDSWFCRRSRQCVKLDKICNEIVDCRYGEDELNCIALAPNDKGKLLADREGTPLISSHGYLLLFSVEKSKWIPACTEELSQAIANDVCTFLGFSSAVQLRYNKNLPTEYEVIKPSSRGKRATEVSHVHNYTHMKTYDGIFTEYQISQTLHDLSHHIYQQSNSRTKRESCSQVYITCDSKSCGKVRELYFTDVPPIGDASLVPWEVTIWASGSYLCGGTIIHKEWVITASKCVAAVYLDRTELYVLGGSFRNSYTKNLKKILSNGEIELRVDSIVSLNEGSNDPNPSLSLLHLEESTENYVQLNAVCLNSSAGEELWKECIITGKYKDKLTYPLLILPDEAEYCPVDEICFKDYSTFADICTSNWSGLISCRKERTKSSPWNAVGIWTYLGDDKLCSSTKRSHKRLSKDTVERIHKEINTGVVNSWAPVACSGLKCPLGICVPPPGICDAQVSCPDLRDESRTCPIPLSYCAEDPFSQKCECPGGGFACSDGVCIGRDGICDGVSQCSNNEDEENCKCAMIKETSEKVILCDGIIDCHDQTDELECNCNTEEQFRCYRSSNQSCIDSKLLCDNVRDCLHNEDEDYCLTLSSTVFVEDDALGIPTVNREGFLLVRITGRWFTYLREFWNDKLSDLVCAKLGFIKSAETLGLPLNVSVIFSELSGRNIGPITAEVFRGRNDSSSTSYNVTFISCSNSES